MDTISTLIQVGKYMHQALLFIVHMDVQGRAKWWENWNSKWIQNFKENWRLECECDTCPLMFSMITHTTTCILTSISCPWLCNKKVDGHL